MVITKDDIFKTNPSMATNSNYSLPYLKISIKLLENGQRHLPRYPKILMIDLSIVSSVY